MSPYLAILAEMRTLHGPEMVIPFLPCLIIPVIAMIGIAGFALWLWMLIDCATNEPSEGNDKVVWILVIALVGPLGALIYLFARRPERKRRFGK